MVSGAALVAACAASVDPADGDIADADSGVVAPPPGAEPWRPDGWSTGIDVAAPQPDAPDAIEPPIGDSPWTPDGWTAGVDASATEGGPLEPPAMPDEALA
jgi:hypothetical protein